MDNKPYRISRFDYIRGRLSILPRYRRIVKNRKLQAEMRLEDKNSLGLIIEEYANDFPNHFALLYEEEKYTYKEYNEWINRYANYFLNKGNLKKGDVAVVFLENRSELLFIVLALGKIGVISSMINTRQRETPLIHSINHAPGKILIIGEELIEAFKDVESKLELTESQQKFLFYVSDKGLIDTPEGYINLKEEVKNEDEKNPPTTREIQIKTPFIYIFTSGTTGLPKAAIITHEGLINGRYHWDSMCGMKRKDIMYITTPFFHSHAWGVAFTSALRYGSTMAIRRKFSASNFWKDARKFKATCFNYIGEICRYLYNQPVKKDDRKNSIKKAIGNGLRLDIWKNFKKRFRIRRIMEFYGATEPFTPNFSNIFNRNFTIGVCFTPYALVKYNVDQSEPICDDNGFLIRTDLGEPGLLIGQVNPDFFYMYVDKKLNEKKILRNVFEEGDMWVNTGDLLRHIGYGHAQFVDRLGDTFRWKGENVSTEEVERVINEFEQVEMCAVYGVLIPNTEGRAGMASIRIQNDEIEHFRFDEFLIYIIQLIPEYAVPKFFRIKKDFETTETLKIQKNKMKKEGYNPNEFEDPVFVMLPGRVSLIPLSKDIFKRIKNGEYKF
jgi:citronellyl-CoA synthetase